MAASADAVVDSSSGLNTGKHTGKADPRTDYYGLNIPIVKEKPADKHVVVNRETSHKSPSRTYTNPIKDTVDRSHIGTLIDIGRPRHINIIVEITCAVVSSTDPGRNIVHTNKVTPEIKLKNKT